MRTFYIFKIKKEYAVLTKNNPYYLFKMLSYIYHLDREDLTRGVELFNKMTDAFNIKDLDDHIYQNYQDNIFYTKFKNIHQFHNIYIKEESKLIIRKKFLLLQSNVIHPTFLDYLQNYEDLFFCDFANKDYFWIEKLYI